MAPPPRARAYGPVAPARGPGADRETPAPPPMAPAPPPWPPLRLRAPMVPPRAPRAYGPDAPPAARRRQRDPRAASHGSRASPIQALPQRVHAMFKRIAVSFAPKPRPHHIPLPGFKFPAHQLLHSLLPRCRSMNHLKQLHAHLIAAALLDETLTLAQLISFCSLSPLATSATAANSSNTLPTQ
uniref:Uncharacterized protein n=1 Tax=Ananas comosus var. bracteatus TaxID=296719 RepID=A0A6V7QCT5_ANACO|nr:unnamed protein product [Ananas comosus var. bracteatus]